MSLTSELARADSPARRFIDDRFAERLRSLRRELPEAVRKQLSTIEIPSPLDINGGELGTIGTAFDYRVRYYFETVPRHPMVAQSGAALFGGPFVVETEAGPVLVDPFPGTGFQLSATHAWRHGLILEFFSALEEVLDRADPVGRRLGSAQEELIARYCLALALFEQRRRAPMADSPLHTMKPGSDLKQLLDLSSAEQVDDLCRLSWRFFEVVQPQTLIAVCNPVFAGSVDVGGADADLLLGDCLLELKTSKNVDVAGWVRQLLGYVLLDYNDALEIRQVGFYAARHACLAMFELGDLLDDMVSREDGVTVREVTDRSGLPFEDNLAALREQFAEVVRQP